MLRTDHHFSSSLRFRISPARIDRLVLVDALAGTARRVYEHSARVDELLDFEVLQRAQKAPRALDIDGLVKRVVLAGKVEISDEVDDAGDARAERVAELAQCEFDCGIGREVGREHREVGALCLKVKPDDPVIAMKRLAERTAEVADSTRDENDRPCVCGCHQQIFTGSRYP